MVKLLIFALAIVGVAWTAPSPSGYGVKVPFLGGIFGGGKEQQTSSRSEPVVFTSNQHSSPYKSSYSSGLGGSQTSFFKGSSSQDRNLGVFGSFIPSSGYGSHSGYSSYRNTPVTNNKWNSGFDSVFKVSNPIKSSYGHYSDSTFGAQSRGTGNGGFKAGGYGTGISFGGQQSNSAWGGKLKETFEKDSKPKIAITPVIKSENSEHAATTFNLDVATGNGISSGYKTGQNTKTIKENSGVWGVTTKEVTANTQTATSGVDLGKKFVSEITKPESLDVTVVKENVESGGYKTGHDLKTEGGKASWTVKTAEVTGSSGFGKSGIGFNDKVEGAISGGFVAPVSDEHASITLVNGGKGSGVSSGFKTASGVELSKKLVSENTKPVSLDVTIVGSNAGSGGYKTGQNLKTGGDKGSWTVKTTEVTGSSAFGKSGIGFNDKVEGGISGGYVTPVSDEHASITLVNGGIGSGVSSGYKTGHDLKTSEEKSGVWSINTKEVTGNTKTAISGVEVGKELVSKNTKPVGLDVTVVGGNVGSGGYKTGSDLKTTGDKGSWTVKTTEVTGSSALGKSGIGFNDKVEGGISGGYVTPVSDEHASITLVNGGIGSGVSSGYKTGHDLKTSEEKSGVWSVTTKEVTGNTKAAISGVEVGKELVSENTKPVGLDVTVVGSNVGSGGYKIGSDLKTTGDKGSLTVKTTEVTGSSALGKSGIGFNDKVEGGISGGYVTPVSDEHASITLVNGGIGSGVSSGYKTGHDLKTSEEKSGVWSVTTKEVTGNTKAAISGVEVGKELVSKNTKPVGLDVTAVGGNVGSGGYKTGSDLKTTGDKGSWTVKTTEVTGSSAFGKSGIGFNDKVEGGISGGYVTPVSDEHASITLVNGGIGSGVSSGYKTGHDLKTSEEKSGVWSINTKEVTGNTKTAISGVEVGKELVSKNTKPVGLDVTVVGGNVGSGGYKTGSDLKTTGDKGSWTVKTTEVTGSSALGKSGIGFNDKVEGGISGGYVTPVSDEHASITLVNGGIGSGVSSGYKTGHDLKTSEKKSGVWSVTTKEVTGNTKAAISGVEVGKELVSENTKPVGLDVTVVGSNVGSSGYKIGSDLKTTGDKGSLTVKTTEVTGSSAFGKSGIGFNDKVEGGISGGYVTPVSDEHASITLVNGGIGSGVSSGYKTGHDLKTSEEKSGVWSVTTKEVTGNTKAAISGVEVGKELVSENTKPVGLDVTVVGGNVGSGGYKTGHDLKTTGDKGSLTVKTTEVTSSSALGKSGIGFNDKVEGGISGGYVTPVSDEHASITLVNGGIGSGVSSGYKTGHDLKTSEEKSGVWSVTTKEVTGNTKAAISGVEVGKELVSKNTKPVGLDVTVVGGNVGSGGYKTGSDLKTTGDKGSWTVKTTEVTGSSAFGKSGIGFNDKVEGGISGGYVTPVSDEHASITLVNGGIGSGVSSGYKSGHDLKTSEEKSGVWSINTKEVTGNTKTAISGVEVGKELVSKNTKPVGLDVTVVGGNVGSGGYKTGSDLKTTGDKGSWTVKTTEVTGSSAFGKSGIGFNDKVEGGISGGYVTPVSDEHASITLVNGGIGSGVSSGYKTGHDLKTSEEKSGVWSVTTKEVTGNTKAAISGVEVGKELVSENTKPVGLDVTVVGSNVGSGGYKIGSDLKTTGDKGSLTVKTTEVTGSSALGKSGIGFNDKVEGGISGGYVTPVSDEHASITLVNGGIGSGVSSGYKTGHDLKTSEEKSGVWSVTTKEVTGNTKAAISGVEVGKELVSENTKPVGLDVTVVGGNVGSGGYKTGHDLKTTGDKGSLTVKTTEVTGSSALGKSGIVFNDKVEGGISGGYVTPVSDEHASITLVNGGIGSGVSSGYKTGHDLKTSEEKSGVWSVTTKEVTGNTKAAISGVEVGKELVSENTKPVGLDVTVVGSNVGSGGYKIGSDLKTTGVKGSWTVKTTEVTGSSAFGKSGIGFNDKVEGGISGGYVTPVSDEHASITPKGYETGHNFNLGGKKSGYETITTKVLTNSNGAAKSFGESVVNQFLTGTARPALIDSGFNGKGFFSGLNTGHGLKTDGESSGAWTIKTKEVSNPAISVELPKENHGGYGGSYQRSYGSSHNGGYGGNRGIFGSLFK